MIRFGILQAIFMTLVLAMGPNGFGQQQAIAWTIKLRYGGGTPIDAGPMGHCTAVFASDGKVKIASKDRHTREGLANVIVYQNDALPPPQMLAIFQAADAAFRGKPFTRNGHRGLARSHNSSAIRRRRLYLARRSLRATEPILMWSAAVPTARSGRK